MFQNLELLIMVSEIIKYLGPQIWEIIPTSIKEIDTIDKFKVAVKNGNRILSM